MNEKFPCIKCGLCCQKVNLIEEVSYLDSGNGVCKYLKNNLCLIYDDRPFLCNSEKVYSKFYSHLTKKEYYVTMLKYCIAIANDFRREDLVFELEKLLNEYK
ncbi:YkgJ family cysteine cluster protein [Brachyspira pulli]|uniref:YkgJ family cysteine cluster protein n=1 Tax=Brachyspira pulli TaxID=310721 RepID=UPI003003B266